MNKKERKTFASNGGKALLKQRGKEYFRKLARKAVAARRRKARGDR